MFKRIPYIFLCVLLLASCSNDLHIDDATVPFDFVVSLDRQILTRVGEDGQGAGVNRCILELYCEGEFYYRTAVRYSGGADFRNVPVAPGETYIAVFWADCGGEDLSDLYYSTGSAGLGLRKVEVAMTGYAGNDDRRDAFCARVENVFVEEQTDSEPMPVTLKRPFAQLNVIAVDETCAEGIFPDKVQLAYSAPKGINLLSGELLENATFEYSAPTFSAFSAGATKLAMDYVFAPADDTNPAITLEFKTFKEDAVLSDYILQDVPFQRGYRTNVMGRFLEPAADTDSKTEITD